MNDTSSAHCLDPEIDARYIDTQRERYASTLAAYTDRLRQLADRIDREGTPRTSATDDDGQPDYLWAASRVVHELHWGVANLNTEGLLSAAADAHNAVRLRTK